LFRKVNADSKNASDKFLTNSSARAKHFVPGAFLKSLAPHNVSYCNFRYSLPDSLDIPERDVQYSPELGIHGHYRVVYNVIQASNYGSNKHKNNVTYCTHATPEFFYYLVEILYRWDGPVSIATFVPNTDASLIICLAERLCHCMPDMSRVSLHFVFPFNYPPEITSCPSSLILPTDCAAPTGLTSGPMETFRNIEGLTYPINVCRNVARIKADTTFILVSDVELFPSKNLVSNFMNMLNSLQKKSGTEYNAYVSKLVFVLPVFEIEASELIPSVKSKLLELYSQNLAFYFHRWVCNHCQRFPGLQRWILRKKQSLDNIVEVYFKIFYHYVCIILGMIINVKLQL
jgi:N-acetyllactosaminide beta-1,3-N-acetylglucosaminyltransferase